jgi:hypothetical protein
MEDQIASPDQLREAFRGIAKDKVRNAFFFFFDKTTCVRETKKLLFPHSRL